MATRKRTVRSVFEKLLVTRNRSRGQPDDWPTDVTAYYWFREGWYAKTHAGHAAETLATAFETLLLTAQAHPFVPEEGWQQALRTASAALVAYRHDKGRAAIHAGKREARDG